MWPRRAGLVALLETAQIDAGLGMPKPPRGQGYWADRVAPGDKHGGLRGREAELGGATSCIMIGLGDGVIGWNICRRKFLIRVGR
jgi:hypothetical protein